MNTFDDQLWSHLVAEHGERLRGARVATAALAATLGEDSQRATGRRRLVRLSAAGVLTGAVAGAALTLGLTGVLGHGTITTSAPGAIRTPSYTLVSYTTGKVALTINPKELFDAAALQSDLARDGIPAKVTAGSFCSSDPAPAGFSQVCQSNRPGGSLRGPEPVSGRRSRSTRRRFRRARSPVSATSSSPTASRWRPWR
jgi:hypothetical protein